MHIKYALDGYRLHFSREWLRDKIASDPDVECEAGEPLEGRTMTTKITVSVNGDYKIPVKQGETVTWVSGRGNEGPKVVDYWPAHGDAAVFVIGPEEPDNG